MVSFHHQKHLLTQKQIKNSHFEFFNNQVKSKLKVSSFNFFTSGSCGDGGL